MLTNQQKQYVGIGLGVFFVILIIIFIVRAFSKKKTDDAEMINEGHLILKQTGKEDIDFTEALISMKDNNREFSKMANVKRACEYIISTGSKIPQEYKSATDEILSLTSNCTPEDCVGEWGEWSSCPANVCANTTRTFSVTTKGNYLGKSCELESGAKHTKKCNVSHCKYVQMPYAKPKSNATVIKTEMGDCKANCLAIDDCQFYVLSNTNMCEYHSIPENLTSLDFEYDSNVNVFYLQHNKDKLVKPTNYPTDIISELTVETAVPISTNITADVKTYEALDGYSIYNYDLDELPEITVEECKTKCSENEKCNYAVYDSEGNMCYLKSVINENVTAFKHPTRNVYSLKISTLATE